ncbi:hypothetical protein G7Z17_g3812 [Cylindrodendrum hubeiense]|uniref:Uncharacterized protein n=1 Tax=Cylindrodendrum hubeiense TaxID=595255 RepID=A0A9P5HA27_9HYPO|nr:hypothetical protein G7Z17_g3812 [Cylindrodendrum hubeiense]
MTNPPRQETWSKGRLVGMPYAAHIWAPNRAPQPHLRRRNRSRNRNRTTNHASPMSSMSPKDELGTAIRVALGWFARDTGQQQASCGMAHTLAAHAEDYRGIQLSKPNRTWR